MRLQLPPLTTHSPTEPKSKLSPIEKPTQFVKKQTKNQRKREASDNAEHINNEDAQKSMLAYFDNISHHVNTGDANLTTHRQRQQELTEAVAHLEQHLQPDVVEPEVDEPGILNTGYGQAPMHILEQGFYDLTSTIGDAYKVIMPIYETPPKLNAMTEPHKMVWANFAVAVDSGAVAHVAPPNVFSPDISPTEKSRSKETYVGADGSPIPKLGSQMVGGGALTRIANPSNCNSTYATPRSPWLLCTPSPKRGMR